MDLFIGSGRRNHDSFLDLAVDLDGDLHFILHKSVFVIIRPGFIKYRSFVAEEMPDFFSEMRCKGGKNSDEVRIDLFQNLMIVRFQRNVFGQGIGQLHHSCDGCIKLHLLRIFGDAFDGVGIPVQKVLVLCAQFIGVA